MALYDNPDIQAVKKEGKVTHALLDEEKTIVYCEIIEHDGGIAFLSHTTEATSRPDIDEDQADKCLAYVKGWVQHYKDMRYSKAPFRSIYLGLKAITHRKRYKEILSDESIKVVKV